MRLAPAVEISSVDGEQQDLHILGYLVDHHDPALRERLRSWREDREHRAERMGEALRELGYELDDSELARRRAKGQSIGRPHLADAVGQPSGERRAPALGGAGRTLRVSRGLPDRREAGLPTPHQANRRRVDPDHPRRRWGGRVGPSVLGRRRTPTPCSERSTASAPGASTAWSASTPPTPASRPSCWTTAALPWACCTTGSSDFHGPTHRLFSRFRAFSTYGRTPALGPIAG